MKTVLLSGLTALILASPAMAHFEGNGSIPGGFVGPSGSVVQSAAQALTARDDSYVVLRGHIVERMGKDNYIFEDASGRLNVEIDREIFGTRTVTPEMELRLTGEVDAHLIKRNEVDVHTLEILPR